MPNGRSTYDERGNQTSSSYFGTDGKPCLHKDGYAEWKSTFDERGNETSVSYFGTDGKPCLIQGRVCRMEATFDERGNQTSASYFGTDGKPCLNKDGYAEVKVHLRRAGKQDQRVLLRRRRQALPAQGRDCRMEGHFDERGNKTSASYFGTDGKPCLNKDGYAGCEGRLTTSGETRPASPTSASTASPA